MRKLLLTSLINILVILFCANNAFSQLNKAFEIKTQLIDPWYIHAISDDTLLIIDPKNQTQALQLRRVPDGDIIESQRVGRGPGELAAQGSKIVNISSDAIFLWDSGASQLLKYDRNLTYKTSYRTNLSALSLAFATDSLAFATSGIPSSNYLNTYEVEKRSISQKPVKKFTTDVDSRLYPLSKNYLLNQGPFLVDDGSLYMGFRFSSLVIKADSDSINFITGKPANIPLPDYNPYSDTEDGMVISAPDIAKYPHATLDFAIDDNYLYVLHSGKKLEAGRLKQVWLASTGKLGKEIENIEYSKIIYMYDKNSGDYLGSLELQEKAKKLAVTDHHIFTLSISEDGVPSLIGYEKEIEH